jgi:DNA-binding SARP family transcriptional activator
VRIQILGPLRVLGEGGRPVSVGGAQLRLLLARLALDCGRVVSADRLIDDLWLRERAANVVTAFEPEDDTP